MVDKFRLSWESVDVKELHRYSNADPMFYSNTAQTVPNSQIPDEHWHKTGPVEFDGDQRLDQYRQLKEWSDADTGFVRNVKLERLVGTPQWGEVEVTA